MKKIVFDARMYGLEHAGIGRYILSLLKNFQLPITNFQIILLVKKDKLEEIQTDLGSQFEYFPVKSNHYSLFEQIEIPLVLKRLKPDLVHSPHFNAPVLWRTNFVVTIHDLIKHYFTGQETTTRSKWLYKIKHLGYKFQVNHALYNSSLIFVPTNFWKKKLAKDFDVPADKIMVTPEAVDEVEIPVKVKGGVANKYQLKPPYLIYTGSVYPHKNIEIVFKALKKLSQVQLEIACSRNVFTDRVEKQVKKMGLEKQVKFLGFVPDKELAGLYQQALGLVQPSLMEGFGLTGLEAMAAGCPVIAADATCLPEVYGQAALYFKPDNPVELANKIKSLVDNKQLRQKMIQLGKSQVGKYSWKKTAELTLAGYKKVLKK